MRIFLSFNSKDVSVAEAIQAGISRFDSTAEIFFSPVSVGAGFHMPKLAEGIARADAFLLLIGPSGVGPWQEVEYFFAFDRHVTDKRFALVPVIAGNHAPGLPFLRTLNWVEANACPDDQILHRILTVLKGESIAAAKPLWQLVDPYRGLEAMTEANSDYFFGRAKETVALLCALAEKPGRCPILIGASGAGKSSIAQAGVFSALKSMRWPDGKTEWPMRLEMSRAWAFLIMRPLGTPLESLASAFIQLWQLDPKIPEHAALPRKWANSLLTGENTLADLIGTTQDELRRRHGNAPARILLYIDQGEELYTLAANSNDQGLKQRNAHRFSEVLSHGLDDGRLLTFASLRADYFDRLQADEPLFRKYEHVDVPPLKPKHLDEIVNGPARLLDVSFEDDQVASRITTAAAAEPGALPLLSYLLTSMWDDMVRRGDATLRLPAHAMDIGSLLAKRGEQFLKINPNEEQTLRRLLTLKLALVPPQGEPLRRVTTREECNDAEWSLATQLAEHPWRLVVIRERESDRRIIAEVAHEALLVAWPKLADWLREERDFLVFKSDIERAERRWRDLNRDDGALLSGFDLARAEELLPSRSADLSSDVILFTKKSVDSAGAARNTQIRFQRRVSIGALAAALFLAAIGIFAWVKWGEATQESQNAKKAESRILEQKHRADEELKRAQKVQSLFLADLARQKHEAGDDAAAVALAIEALSAQRDPSPRPYIPEAEFQLETAWRDLRELFVFRTDLTSAAFSADGKSIIAVTQKVSVRDRLILKWEAERGNVISQKTFSSWNQVQMVIYEYPYTVVSPDGSCIVIYGNDGSALIRIVAQERLGQLEIQLPRSPRVRFSPDSKRIVAFSSESGAQGAYIWDALTGKLVGQLIEHPNISVAAFSPDSKLLVTNSANGPWRLWNVETSRQMAVAVESSQEAGGACLAFSSDAKRLATSCANETINFWDPHTGKRIGNPYRAYEKVKGLALSPDPNFILTTHEDDAVRVWNSTAGAPVVNPFKVTLKGLRNASFSPDGKHILTLADGTARVWEFSSPRSVSQSVNLGQERLPTLLANVVLSRDGKRVATVAGDGKIVVWDAETRSHISELLDSQGKTFDHVAFSPDSKRIVTASSDRTARIWDAETGMSIRALNHDDAVYCAALSPNGKRVVTGFGSRTARVWELDSGNIIFSLSHDGRILSAVFSPDGQHILTASGDGTARTWLAVNGQPTGVTLQGPARGLSSASYSADGKRIVTVSADGQARIWDAKTGEPKGEWFEHGAELVMGMFSPNGERVLTISRSGTAYQWDAETSKLVGERKNPIGSTYSAAFSPDGSQLYVAGDYGVTRWELSVSTADLVSRALLLAPRCLTPGERRSASLPPDLPQWCFGKWPYNLPEWIAWIQETRAGSYPPMPAEPK